MINQCRKKEVVIPKHVEYQQISNMLGINVEWYGYDGVLKGK